MSKNFSQIQFSILNRENQILYNILFNKTIFLQPKKPLVMSFCVAWLLQHRFEIPENQRMRFSGTEISFNMQLRSQEVLYTSCKLRKGDFVSRVPSINSNTPLLFQNPAMARLRILQRRQKNCPERQLK